MVGLAPKWVRLAPNGTNPGLFKFQFQYIPWLGTPSLVVLESRLGTLYVPGLKSGNTVSTFTSVVRSTPGYLSRFSDFGPKIDQKRTK